MHLTDFRAPDTLAARGALELARQYQSPAITAHALRSWLWAEAFARVDGIAEVDHVGVALTAGAGWPAERRQRVLEVIVRHNWPRVDPARDAEGHLLEIATALDISGARPDALPEAFRREVLSVYPRGTLAAEFGACVIDQAARKPETAARRLVDGGVIDKLAANPLERLST